MLDHVQHDDGIEGSEILGDLGREHAVSDVEPETSAMLDRGRRHLDANAVEIGSGFGEKEPVGAAHFKQTAPQRHMTAKFLDRASELAA